jgi:hypothetical protein
MTKLQLDPAVVSEYVECAMRNITLCLDDALTTA